jgi:hypothetical protein
MIQNLKLLLSKQAFSAIKKVNFYFIWEYLLENRLFIVVFFFYFYFYKAHFYSYEPKNFLKSLAERIGTDSKEVRLNVDYFRQYQHSNAPFAIIQISQCAIQNNELVKFNFFFK